MIGLLRNDRATCFLRFFFFFGGGGGGGRESLCEDGFRPKIVLQNHYFKKIVNTHF